MSKKPSYHKSVLPNGITVVSETHPQSRTLSIGVWVRVGSAYERGSSVGLSHCIEHLLFKGTETRTATEIATVLESLGGDLNAFTEREMTCFHATVLSEHAEIALEVLGDLLFAPLFDPGDIEKERQVLLQELSMIEDNPDDMIHDVLLANVWKKQPLGQGIMGTKANLLGFDREQILAHYEKYFGPENMVISIAGGVDHRTLIGLCRKFFCAKSRPIARRLKAPKPVRCRFSPGYTTVPSRSKLLNLLMGFAAPGLRDRGRFETLMLSVYLGGGMSSRLFQEVREKAALAYTIESDYVTFDGGGVVSFYVQLASRSLKPCLDILLRELKKVRDESIPKDRLEQIKTQLRGGLLLSNELMETRQEAMARHELFFGRYYTIDELVRSIDRVSVKSVGLVAKKIFMKHRLGWVISGKIPDRMPRLSMGSA